MFGENKYIADDRLCELVKMYHEAFPSESIKDIIEDISALRENPLPTYLISLCETVEYEPPIAFNTECLVCFNTLEPKQQVYVFNCRHCVCKECLSEYKSAKCPICRISS